MLFGYSFPKDVATPSKKEANMRPCAPLLLLALVALVHRYPIAAATSDDPLIVSPYLFNPAGGFKQCLSIAPRTAAVIYSAAANDFKFNHHPHLTSFNGRLYAMWSSGASTGDSPSQRVVDSSSADGAAWSPWQVLAANPDGPDGPRRLTACGWWPDARAGRLVAYYADWTGPENNHQFGDHLTLKAIESANGATWDSTKTLLQNVMFNENPRQTSDGTMLVGAYDRSAQVAAFLTKSPDGLSDWKPVNLPQAENLTEPTWIERRDHQILWLFRDVAKPPALRLFATVGPLTARALPPAQKTAYPDAGTKAAAGRLPDGRTFLISNPNGIYPKPVPLAIALTPDGQTFTKAYAIRTEGQKAFGDAYPSWAILGPTST